MQHRTVGLGWQSHTDTVTRATVVSVLAEEKVVDVACGKSHTLFLTEAGDVYACGSDAYGQCGRGRCSDSVLSPVPTLVPGNIKQISAGIDYSMALDQDGRLYSFGYPANGRLGCGTDGS